MRFPRLVVTVTLMTATLLTPTVASADDDVARLYAHAAKNDWGPVEWAEFERWVAYVRFLEIAGAAERGEHWAVESLIWIVFPDDFEWAKATAWRESRYQPWARNQSGASGLMQLMLPLHASRFTAVGKSPAEWADPVANLLAARALYDGAGRAPWRF